MNGTTLSYAIDADLPGLLRQLHHVQLEPGASHALRDQALQAIGPSRWIAAPTLVGAVLIGGTELAHLLIQAQVPSASEAQRTEALRLALAGLIEPPPGATAAQAEATAQWLKEGFGLAEEAASLPDLVRIEFLASHGAVEQLGDVAEAAGRLGRWAPALKALTRLREALGAKTPKAVYGMMARCHHRLGRYDEARRCTEEGLGADLALLAIPEIQSEATLLQRWGRFEQPVISILCTTYNHERYLEDALRGFMSQVCDAPFEILIHDDASTDRTQEIIRRWHARYPSLIRPTLQTANQLSQGVRIFDQLLAQARGEFVALCEGDDFWIRADKLQRQLDFLREHAKVHSVAHNHYHFVESALTVKPWRAGKQDVLIPQRKLMAVRPLLWVPTLMFRRTFSTLPPERDLAASGDYVLTSYLGSLGQAAYLDTFIGAVRRENPFSSWMPLPEVEKERRRVRNFTALVRMHERLGNVQAVGDLFERIDASPLKPDEKAALVGDAAAFRRSLPPPAAPTALAPESAPLRAEPARQSVDPGQLSPLDEQRLADGYAQLSVKLKKRPLVLFFGRNTFSDNSKYLYLQALAAPRGYEVLWCTTSGELAGQLEANQLPCLLLSRDVDRTLDLLLHAAVALFTLNPFESVGLSQSLLGCLAGAKQVQLWHGISVKKLTLQLLGHFGARSVGSWPYWLSSIRADHVLSTAAHFDGYWHEVFGCRHLVRAGMPRNEVLLRAPRPLEMLGAELSPRAQAALESGRPAVLVVPTWQRDKQTELTGTAFMKQAVQFARAHKANIFFKAHPTYFGKWNPTDDIDGLHLVDPGTDIYPWMSRFSALATDYSSIMFDFLLTGKPVLTLDLQPGQHQDYEPDYGLVPAGDFRSLYTTTTLGARLREALFDDQRREQRQAYAERLFESDPTRACADLLQLIDALVEQSQRPDVKVWAPGAPV